MDHKWEPQSHKDLVTLTYPSFIIITVHCVKVCHQIGMIHCFFILHYHRGFVFAFIWVMDYPLTLLIVVVRAPKVGLLALSLGQVSSYFPLIAFRFLLHPFPVFIIFLFSSLVLVLLLFTCSSCLSR